MVHEFLRLSLDICLYRKVNRIPGLPIQKKPFTLKNDPHIGKGTDACWINWKGEVW